MKILLINPNQYRTPPVPPLGLAHLWSALRGSPHRCRILDLCFSEDPVSSLHEALHDFKPDIAGMTIRNIDTVIYQNNVFFLDSIKKIVNEIKLHSIPVLLGGSGYSFIPGGILEYLGADWGITGPAEKAIVEFLDSCEKKMFPHGTVINGWESGIDSGFRISPDSSVYYSRYTSERGILGFETQKGCMEQCSFCSEGRGRVLFRNPESVVEDIRDFADKGFDTFHLCDTEFNQELSHCTAFLELLVQKGPKINWVLYMKCFPYDDNLFRLLKKSGTGLVTLSLPSGARWLDHAETLCSLARKHDIKLAVDLLVGFPGETLDATKRVFDALRKCQPDTVGVNSFFRLFPGLTLTKRVLESPDYRKYMSGAVSDNPHWILPVFYNHLSIDTLQDIIGGDPLFKIEGFERTSNYERI